MHRHLVPEFNARAEAHGIRNTIRMLIRSPSQLAPNLEIKRGTRVERRCGTMKAMQRFIRHLKSKVSGGFGKTPFEYRDHPLRNKFMYVKV